MQIVHATPEDAGAVLKLYRSLLGGAALWTEQYPDENTIEFDLKRDALFLIKNDRNEVIASLSIDEDENVIGLDCWSPQLEPSGELARLAVSKDYQGQGLAKKLILYAFDVLRSRGYRGCRLLVVHTHEVAKKAYSSMGFRTVGTCHLYEHDYLCMERALSISDEVLALADPGNADFCAKLTPGIDRSRFLGARLPALRELAKAVEKREDYPAFLSTLPHSYYDEDILHSILLSRIKDVPLCIEQMERFLPYIDNWAVCDTLRPKCFAKADDTILLPKLREWAASDHVYTCRAGLNQLMSFYLDARFQPEFLEIPAAVQGEDYYIRMMVAWYYATALAKQWDATIPYLTEHRLPVWTHNKTIQKARESFRITPEQKEYLKTLRRPTP